jgi:hypothetical protein
MLKAKSVMTYSAAKVGKSAKKIRALWEIPSDKKITLLTTSSADEQFSFGFVGLIASDNENYLDFFENNLDWINYTINLFRDLPDSYLVIRIHPREFANKRETLNSETGRTTLAYLQSLNLPKNIIINEPSDGISLYDLIQITELVINSTSTVGLEFASLGIQSITVSPNLLMAYPPELSLAAYSEESYRSLILSPGLFDNNRLLIQSLKWIDFKFADCSIRIPKILSLMDRIYFGVLARTKQRYPEIYTFAFSLFRFFEFFFEKLDRRRINKLVSLDPLPQQSSRTVNKITEIFSIMLAKIYLYHLKR